MSKRYVWKTKRERQQIEADRKESVWNEKEKLKSDRNSKK